MSTSKYSTVLTIILVVLVVAILIGIGILLWNKVLKPRKDTKDKLEAIEEFDIKIGKANEEIESNPDNSNYISQDNPEDSTNPGGNGGNGQVSVRKKPTYKGYVMLGYITIPKTRVKEPILDTVTPDALNTAVAVLYPSNPQLNEPGNIVIIGHNYRNGTFFSNNKNLAVGDILKIKDNSGRELTYTIYKKFQTSENDTSFYNRDTGGIPEVTLSTCTDDVKARIIIQAKAEV